MWALGGVVAMIGALTYAELASTYPQSGGDYVYLTRAFGPGVGFLFGWAQLTVIMTGSIGMLAYIFAGYAAKSWDLGPRTEWILAGAAVLALSAINVFGVVLAVKAQNLLTVVKVIGLTGVLLAGFLGPRLPPKPLDSLSSAASEVPPAAAAGESSASVEKPSNSFWQVLPMMASGMVLVFLTYGGWNDAAFFVAEMRDTRKITAALLLGTAGVAAIYLLINAAYLRALGFDAARHSSAIAADACQGLLGGFASKAMSVLIMISALGAANGLIFAGSRLYATLGADHGVFAALDYLHPRTRSPVAALVVQAAISLAMIAAVGSSAGHTALNWWFQSLGLQEVSWAGRQGFETLLRCTAPFFWLFFLLTSLSLFVLRRREPAAVRPFRTPWYPWLPSVFTLVCAGMLWSGIQYSGRLALVGAGLLLLGVPLWLVSNSRRPVGDSQEHLGG